nr:O-succinylhomoserine sulfhydrylase [Laribacter sp.]
SSFLTESAEDARQLFAGEADGYTYSRFTNPAVNAFEERLAALEGGERCQATASGMAAIHAVLFTHLSAGDHVVASRSLFGATYTMLATLLPRFGIEVSFVEPADLSAWQSAVRSNTRLFFLETPSNPQTELTDIAAVAGIAHAAGALLVVDNCFCSPALQTPLALGADLVVHSGTKYIDGQGRVLGGAVVGSDKLIEPVYLYVRTTGPTLSAFNAWVLLSGLETLFVRMERHCTSALKLATWLEQLPQVRQVRYPGLPSHPQFELARRQQRAGGAVIAFELDGGREAAWKVVDAISMISRTGNFGDVKSTLTHPATTTHGRLAPEVREAAGITEGLLRLSVGLEHPDDIQADLLRGLA